MHARNRFKRNTLNTQKSSVGAHYPFADSALHELSRELGISRRCSRRSKRPADLHSRRIRTNSLRKPVTLCPVRCRGTVPGLIRLDSKRSRIRDQGEALQQHQLKINELNDTLVTARLECATATCLRSRSPDSSHFRLTTKEVRTTDLTSKLDALAAVNDE